MPFTARLHFLLLTCVVLLAPLACTGTRAEENAPLSKENLSKSTYLIGSDRLSKAEPAEIVAGEPVTGRLDRNDPVLRDQTHYDLWSYRGAQGERLTITLESADFDAYLLVGRENGNEIEILAEDDDSAGGTDARITLDLPADGSYLVVANSVFPNEVGAYTLRVESHGVRTAAMAEAEWARRYPGGGDPGERYALLVGIDDYQGIGNNLNGPVADARLMRQILLERFGFRPENIVLLLDREASREHIAQAFLRHLGQAGPDGVAIFYYSGHGLQMDDNYALTGALDPEPDGVDEAIYVWGEGGRGSIILDDELGFLADRLRTDRVLFIIDACNSGTGTRGAAGGQPKEMRFADVQHVLQMPTTFLVGASETTETATTARGYADLLNQPQRHLLLAASADDQFSWTASGWPKYGGTISVFTYYLAEQLEVARPGLSFDELMQRVRDQTVSYTQSTYGTRQTPRVEGAQASTSIHEFLRRR